MKIFNTTAICIPSKHYMVDISDRIKEIRKLVDAGKYFTINRARQYGKTTTLATLKSDLFNNYYVVSMDFQDYGAESFESEDTFCRDFASDFCSQLKKISQIEKREGFHEAILKLIGFAEDESKKIRFYTTFKILKTIWEHSPKPIVLMIDEVDSAANNQVFLDFLAQLRSHYLKREEGTGYQTFQSVILASVTDIKHLKGKIRSGDHKANSPWNIAADFDIDMSLSVAGIQGMLSEYEADHHTGMDTGEVARQLYEYTSGYPYLVSKLCQLIDEKLCVRVPDVFRDLKEAWTTYGIDEAVKLLLSEPYNTLFESVTGKLTNDPKLKEQIRLILLRGETFAWLTYDERQQKLYMFGLIKNVHNTVAVSNRIFEMLLYSHYIGESNANHELKQKASEIKNIKEKIRG